MLSTGANIRALMPGFGRDFERGRGMVPMWWDTMAEQVPSTTSQELQGFVQLHFEQECRGLEVSVRSRGMYERPVATDAHRHFLSGLGIGPQGTGEG